MHWLMPTAVVGALCIFSATFFAYANAHANHRAGGYAPALLGLSLFVIAMTGISYFSLPGANSWVRLFTAIGIAILESTVFGFLLLFLLVSSFGS